jgi:FtsZ-interacting cell division protein ZipA
MNQLTLYLLAIGASIILLVILFNWWQGRKLRQQIKTQYAINEEPSSTEILAEGSFQESTPDIATSPNLSDQQGEPEFEIQLEIVPKTESLTTLNESVDDEMLESSETLPESDLTSDEVTIPSPELALPSEISKEVDYFGLIKLPAAEVGERLRKVLIEMSNLDKPIFVYGLNESGSWQPITRELESEMFTQAIYSIQLADRGGPISEETFRYFEQAIEKTALGMGVEVEWIGANDPISFAKALDQFCIEVDQTVSIHVVNSSLGRFMGTKFRGLIEGVGLKLDTALGSYLASNDEEQPLFKVSNLESSPFSLEMLKTNTLKGVTFQMDIARAPHCTETFNQMVFAAKSVMEPLNAVLVDDHQRELTDSQIDKIRQQLRMIEVQMQMRGIVSGTPLAMRLFA